MSPTIEDEDFVLDTSLFDVNPSAPVLMEAELNNIKQAIPASFSGPRGLDASRTLERSINNSQRESRQETNVHKASPPAHDRNDQYEDPLAEFEAWLNSGAVDILEG